MLILIEKLLSRAKTHAGHERGQHNTCTHVWAKHSVEYNTTGFRVVVHLRSGRFSSRSMFHIKFVKYTCWALLWSSAATSSQVSALCHRLIIIDQDLKSMVIVNPGPCCRNAGQYVLGTEKIKHCIIISYNH